MPICVHWPPRAGSVILTCTMIEVKIYSFYSPQSSCNYAIMSALEGNSVPICVHWPPKPGPPLLPFEQRLEPPQGYPTSTMMISKCIHFINFNKHNICSC